MKRNVEPCPVCGLVWHLNSPSPCLDDHTFREFGQAVARQASTALKADLKRIMAK